jgi:hypothetical protein
MGIIGDRAHLDEALDSPDRTLKFVKPESFFDLVADTRMDSLPGLLYADGLKLFQFVMKGPDHD